MTARASALDQEGAYAAPTVSIGGTGGTKERRTINFYPHLVAGLKIMHKEYRNRPMSAGDSAENREISSKRWAMQRIFRSLKRWFGSGSTQLKGLQKVHVEPVMEAIAHDLNDSLV